MILFLLALSTCEELYLVCHVVDLLLVTFPDGGLVGLELYTEELHVLPQLHQLSLALTADLTLNKPKHRGIKANIDIYTDYTAGKKLIKKNYNTQQGQRG